ncbi:hypothetical protein [Bacteroides faecis]|nr:hypothetical protein [Bacteroides faecis]MDC7981535.1 hypothetical protein [Bacteroides faecis]
MRTIIISLILLFVFQTVYSQKYSYTDTDIIVCDGDSTYLFKNILYPSVSYFMSCDSLNSDLAYIHYENWASSRKTESILQIKYEKGSLYVISEFIQINMSPEIEKYGTAPIFLITGNRKIKCGNLPLPDTGIIDWTKYHNSEENEKRCLVFDKRMTFKKELFFNQKLVFDERLFRLISDIKLELVYNKWLNLP